MMLADPGGLSKHQWGSQPCAPVPSTLQYVHPACARSGKNSTIVFDSTSSWLGPVKCSFLQPLTTKIWFCGKMGGGGGGHVGGGSRGDGFGELRISSSIFISRWKADAGSVNWKRLEHPPAVWCFDPNASLGSNPGGKWEWSEYAFAEKALESSWFEIEPRAFEPNPVVVESILFKPPRRVVAKLDWSILEFPDSRRLAGTLVRV